MLAWIRSPRGSTVTATAIAVILALYWIAPWQKQVPFRLPLMTPGQPGDAQPVPAPVPSVAGTPAAPAPTAIAPKVMPPSAAPALSTEAQPAAVPPAPGPSASLSTANPSAVTPSPAGSPQRPAPTAPLVSGSAAAPTFDVVRVEKHGETVIAGRAEPGSQVTLLDNDKAVAHVTADAGGQFAVLPDDLAEGSHFLTLQVQKPGQEPVRSGQGVAVSVTKGGAGKPLVALLSPDQAAKVLSGGLEAPGVEQAAGDAPSAPMPVAIQSVEAGHGGKLTAAGVAHPGSQCRVYLNGSYLADVTAGKDGHWSIEVQKGMKAGRYTVRADEIDAGSGKVTHRAEVPFDYPTLMAGNEPGSERQSLMAPPKGAASAPIAPALHPPAAGATITLPGVPMPPPRPAGTQFASAAPGNTTASPTTAPSVASPPAEPTPMSSSSQPGASSEAPQQANQDVAVASPAAAPSPSAAVIADLQTATVVRGDSLWRISRKILGRGIQYTEIYASNTNQIRDPDLIYPGQIFVVPNTKAN